MSRRSSRTAGLAAAAALVGALAALSGGCGEKIAIPQPIGLFSVSAYILEGAYPEPAAVQVAVINNNLFVLTADGALVKRNLNYQEIGRVENLEQPTAFCRGDQSQLIYVWEQGARRVRVFNSTDLAPQGQSSLPAVRSVASMAACSTGVSLAAGSRTFLYLSDPDSGVIHRYDYNVQGGLSPFGLLARSGGEAARFVKRPAGLAVDHEGMLLVCDADSSRNWVIRFDPTPDLTDETPAVGDQGPWRGQAILFAAATCNPPAAADYTLGDAAACGQTDWVGGPSAAPGEFDRPRAVAVDGLGRIFVADTGNQRVQIFTARGDYRMLFGSAAITPAPSSLGLVDWRRGSAAGAVNYGAYVFLLAPGGGEVRKFISSEHYIYLNQQPPPPPS